MVKPFDATADDREGAAKRVIGAGFGLSNHAARRHVARQPDAALDEPRPHNGSYDIPPRLDY